MKIILLALITVVAWVGYHYGEHVSIKDMWTFFEALRTTTSIVFGVMGALLAIVYPEVIKDGIRGNTSVISSKSNVHYILSPLVQSALLLVLLVLLGPIYAWAEATFGDQILSRSIFFSLLAVLSLWQVIILVALLRPLDLMQQGVTKSKAIQEWRSNIHSRKPPKS